MSSWRCRACRIRRAHENRGRKKPGKHLVSPVTLFGEPACRGWCSRPGLLQGLEPQPVRHCSSIVFTLRIHTLCRGLRPTKAVWSHGWRRCGSAMLCWRRALQQRRRLGKLRRCRWVGTWIERGGKGGHAEENVTRQLGKQHRCGCGTRAQVWVPDAGVDTDPNAGVDTDHDAGVDTLLFTLFSPPISPRRPPSLRRRSRCSSP